jgi:hypothetical protein
MPREHLDVGFLDQEWSVARSEGAITGELASDSLAVAQNQKADVDELIGKPLVDQSPESMSQRSAEFDDLFGGMPNPMHDDVAEPTEKEETEADMDKINRKPMCYSFLHAFCFLDLWHWIWHPADLVILRKLDQMFDLAHGQLRGVKSLIDQSATGADVYNAKPIPSALVYLFRFFGLSSILVYIFFIVFPIVLTFIAFRRGENNVFPYEFTWGPTFVPLAFHAILVYVYCSWSSHLHQMRTDFASNAETARKGSEVSNAAMTEAEEAFQKRYAGLYQKRGLEVLKKTRKRTVAFGLCVFAIFLIAAACSFKFVPDTPYRPQFVGGSIDNAFFIFCR